MVSFITKQPPPNLADHVCELWLLNDDGSTKVGLPKPYVEIVVSLEGVHLWKAAPDACSHEYRTGWVTPIQDGPRYASAIGNRTLIGARLHPWAARGWLGEIPPGNGPPPPLLSDMIGAEAERLRNWLLEAPDEDTLFTRFGSWLALHFETVEHALHAPKKIVQENPNNVEALACSLQITSQTLRRTFAKQSGLSPKRWLILHRLDKVLRDPRLTNEDCSLATLAADHGYADQAHLAREMMRFSGTSPTALRTRKTDFPPHMRSDD